MLMRWRAENNKRKVREMKCFAESLQYMSLPGQHGPHTGLSRFIEPEAKIPARNGIKHKGRLFQKGGLNRMGFMTSECSVKSGRTEKIR